jgi:gas vesicle protein
MYEGQSSPSEMNGRGSEFVIGLLCGAAVGTAVGLLLATKSGAELREQIAERAGQIGRRVGDTYNRASGAASDAIDKGREAIKKGREKFEEVRSDYMSEQPGTQAAETSANVY